MIRVPGATQPVLPKPPVSASPELFWIATDGPSSCLWPTRHGNETNDVASPRLLERFGDALIGANELLVLDPHFAGNGMASVWALLPFVTEVKILTQRLRELNAWLSEEGLALPSNTEARQARQLFHDRFAIIDGDLWHFGSTVGGSYHALSAASHGWGPHAAEMRHLFNAWWGSP